MRVPAAGRGRPTAPPSTSSFGLKTVPRPLGHEPGNRIRSETAFRARTPTISAPLNSPCSTAVILLAAWTWWMLAARVPQYESTTNVQIESGHALAYFAPDVLSRLQARANTQMVTWMAAVYPARFNPIAVRPRRTGPGRRPQSPIPASSSVSAPIVEISRISPRPSHSDRLTREQSMMKRTRLRPRGRANLQHGLRPGGA